MEDQALAASRRAARGPVSRCLHRSCGPAIAGEEAVLLDGLPGQDTARPAPEGMVMKRGAGPRTEPMSRTTRSRGESGHGREPEDDSGQGTRLLGKARYLLYGLRRPARGSGGSGIGRPSSRRRTPAGGRASLGSAEALFGVLIYPLLVLGDLMLLGLLAAMASAPVIIFEPAVVRRKVARESRQT